MKDELGDEIITEFIALRSKMYAYKYITDQNKMITDKRCKGIKKYVVRKTLCFNDYKSTLVEGKIIYRDQVLFNIRSMMYLLIHKTK